MYLKKVDTSKEKQKADKKSGIMLMGSRIATDNKGRISLTDLWKHFGSVDKKDPWSWQQRESSKEFIEYLQSLIPPKKGVIELIVSKTGRYGGTFADKQIALAYAKWLSPEAHKIVNDVFFERIEEEKNPQLAIDRAVNTWKKKGKTDEWIEERLNGKASRLIFTNTLMDHGVTGKGYGDCTNAIYKPLYGGDAKLVKKKKNLPANSNIRENMSPVELATVNLAERISAQNIKTKDIHGNNGCKNECLRTSSIIAQAVKASLSK